MLHINISRTKLILISSLMLLTATCKAQSNNLIEAQQPTSSNLTAPILKKKKRLTREEALKRLVHTAYGKQLSEQTGRRFINQDWQSQPLTRSPRS